LTRLSATGALSGSKTILGGTVGPPTQGGGAVTCTQTVPSTSVITGCKTSGNIVTDAKSFPCPPTAAQQAAGVTCVLAIGDQGGARAVGVICFTGETNCPPSTT